MRRACRSLPLKGSARNVVAISMAGTAVLAAVVALQPPLELPAGITFVLLSFALGLGMGGVFTWVAQRAPAERVAGATLAGPQQVRAAPGVCCPGRRRGAAGRGARLDSRR